MKQTRLNRRTPLKARKRINPISPRRLREMRAEIPVRIALCERCGGKPIYKDFELRINGKREVMEMVFCLGGVCEICGKPAGNEILHPHELNLRSRGGKLSLENSKMAHLVCHKKSHGENVVDSQPMWSKTKQEGLK